MKKSKMLKMTGGVLAGIALHLSSISPANAQPASVVSAPVASPPRQESAAPIDPALLATEIKTPKKAETRVRLKQSAANYFKAAPARKADFQHRATQLGMPLRLPGVRGGDNILIDLTPEGEPLYVGPNNIAAADSVSVDNEWPEGSITAVGDWPTGESGHELDGTDQIIGLWDPSGSIRTSHEQLANARVLQLDLDPSAIGAHATWVAGTLASAGQNRTWFIPGFGNFNVGNHSRGAAFAATVHAYDLEEITGERDDEAANGMPLSSHSYGIRAGWVWDGADWIWYGSGATQEDPKFGAYLSTLTGVTEITPRQLDIFSQSAPHSLLMYSAGNDRNEGPGGSVVYYLPNDPNKQNPQTATRDWSDGDDGFYDSLNPSACAKNILTVGGVHDIAGGYVNPASVVLAPFSSMGPTDDGRIKPDVVAAALRTGTGDRNPLGLVGFLTTGELADDDYLSDLLTIGTSFSTPTVAGGLSLVLQLRSELLPVWSDPDFPWPVLSSTLRGLAIHTAREAGENPGPDFQFGYGLFDAEQAASLVEADAEATFNPNGGHPKPYVKEVLLSETRHIQFRARIPSSPTAPLKVTICWNDPAGAAQSLAVGVDPTASRLVNDLDLRIYPPGTTEFDPTASSTFKPWVLDPDLDGKSAESRGAAARNTGIDVDDSINNVEQVVVNSPTASSDYIVRITHKTSSLSGDQQWVSIIVSGADVIPAPDLVLTATSGGGNNVNITWPAVVSGIYRIQGRANFTDPWTDATGDISANLETMTATVQAPTSPYFWRGVRYY